jgi:ribonuclease-3
MDDLLSQATSIETVLGYQFNNRKLLSLALTHRSYFNENKNLVSEYNERLEFVGDSVIGLIISEYLYRNFPASTEGELSCLKARLVEASACALYFERLGLADFALLGKGEKSNIGRGRDSILADLLEAFIGAVFLDGGLEAAQLVFWKHFQNDVSRILKNPARNWKAELQAYSQKHFHKIPLYEIELETGPDHQKTFNVRVVLNEKLQGKGSGCSKKEAEQAAAEEILKSVKKR